MRRFLYLRIVAIINGVISTLFMILLIASSRQYMSENNTSGFIFLILLFILFAVHAGFIMYVYINYYPANYIPKSLVISIRIADAICWIFVVILLLGMIVLLFDEVKKETKSIYFQIALKTCTLLCLLMSVQLIGGFRLLKTIKRNARAQLENSFS